MRSKFLLLSIIISLHCIKSVLAQTVVINEIMSSNVTTIADEDDDYSDWIELFNSSLDTLDLSGFGISDDSTNVFKWIFPDIKIFPNQYLVIFASDKNRIGENLHTNFKLSSDGEVVVLTNKQGVIVDKVDFGKLGPDISYGRKPDGSNSWFFFQNATPANSNLTQEFFGRTEEPLVSMNDGFYNSPISITITSSADSDRIYYTLDGTDPDENSQPYISQVLITETKVLRTRAYKTGFLASKISTNSYFIDFASSLPVISLSTDPKNLFDEDYGIYVLGSNADSTYPYSGANFWQDWERPIHVDIFEGNGLKDLTFDGGVQIFGGWSRALPQKSLAIFARAKYGYSTLNNKLFSDLPYNEYEAFVLRNSGNDWGYTMFRDGLMTSLLDGIDIDKQDYRPSVVFINGEYWGILNIREKVNEHFLAQHHNVNPDSLDILENHFDVIQGSNSDFIDLYTFIENSDMSNSTNYDYINAKMEVDNFIKYFVSEIYFANQDWPAGNVKYWRNSNNGKWRWILYDTDWGFGYTGPNAYLHNTLDYATDPSASDDASNAPWSTLILRKLLENELFKIDFINCFADFSNSIFDSSAVIEKINSMKSLIEPEIQRHGERWGTFDLIEWLDNVQVLRDFANQRIHYLRLYFIQKFGLGSLTKVNLSVSDSTSGSIKINSVDIKTKNWRGDYFAGIPINIIAKSKPGFRFAQWEGSITSDEDTLSITLSDSLDLRAVFDADSIISFPKIVINEINYNSSSTFNPEDWVELYNNDDQKVDISNWIFKDSDDSHIFKIPEGTILDSSEYLVICIDTSLFKLLFSEVNNYIGNTGFGLSGSGEQIRLYDNQMNIIDSLIYDDNSPWPSEADGNGPTLSLKDPELDNAQGENWFASSDHGTPGKSNDITTRIHEESLKIATEFKLFQNYPNPFNPVCVINYSVKNQQFVTLKIFNSLGEEIKTLVNEEQPSGFYTVEFNALNLSSGIYFYRLTAGSFKEIKKMVVLK